MAILDKHKNRFIFHFTDIRNLDSIIKNGLLCTNIKNRNGIKHKNIANEAIQERRANTNVPIGRGGNVHDYVPFYFSSINSMLLKLLNQKNVDQGLIIYLCINIQRLEKSDVVYTDASVNTVQPPTFYSDISYLDNLNWELIESKKWKVDTDEEKHKKMAEALIFGKVDIREIDAIVVYNNEAKKCVQKIFKHNRITPPDILFDNNDRMSKYRFYYTKFFIKERENETLVTGPLLLLRSYKHLINRIERDRRREKNTYNYSTIHDLLQVLDKDISVIPELKNIEGLCQNYSPHNDTVDEHTKKVVAKMKSLIYYENAAQEKKDILLFAAYLHDIGKGPKEKWNGGIMTRAYLDHTADAIPMLERILTEEIKALSEEDIRMICMLVVYHDIVGDCIGNNRDRRQIAELIDNPDDLDMLLAISEADVGAIDDLWYQNILDQEKSFKEQIMQMKKI